MNDYNEKILQEYELVSGSYREFGVALTSLLENILRHGEFKYHIDTRLKDAKSLTEKIKRKSLNGKVYKNIVDIKDIVGIRIIFYSKSDRNKFTAKMMKEFRGAIYMEERKKNSGYHAIHAIISLGKKRLKLSEYSAFTGMECEVQLSLILEHAWAEIEHDILYKENWGFRDLDKINYIYMRERMEQIMKGYIHKASTELENTIREFKKIKRETLAH